MKPALAFLLVVASIGAYFYLALVHAIFQRVPVAHLVGASLGVVALAALAWARRSRVIVALAVVALALTGAFTWFTFSFSTYAQTTAKVRPGDKLDIDVELRDANGAPFDFEGEARRAPATVIVFYRGVWCGYCRAELRALHEKADLFKAMGVRVLAVSVDDPARAKEMQDRCGAATFTFVSDPDGKTLDALGLRHAKGNPSTGSDIAQSATVIVDKSGTIRWMNVAETYRVRPDPDVVVTEAAKAASKGS